MTSNIDSPARRHHSDLQEPREPDLTIPDYRTLTHEQWEDLKRQVARRARAERAKVVRHIFTALASWRQKTIDRRFRKRARPAEQIAIEPEAASQ